MNEIISTCRQLAEFSEEEGFTTRTFLSAPMKSVHRVLGGRMQRAGMEVTVDAAGNLRGFHAGHGSGRLIIGSHLDTVPRAGAFDGILGVVLGLALVEQLHGRQLSYGIEVIGFSEEEGVRFGTPFLGSRALVGTLDEDLLVKRDAGGATVRDAIHRYGLDPLHIADCVVSPDAFGYLEFHIEQGPVLESKGLALGVVEAIAGQSRYLLTWEGKANHAGTTPMQLRHDALAGAAEWVVRVETQARETAGMVATVGQMDAHPGAGNVIPGRVRTSLDVRHAADGIRTAGVEKLLQASNEIAARRGLTVKWEPRLEQTAVAMDAMLTSVLREAAPGAPDIVSGAGHDAMIMAEKLPVAMLFLRSPGGISHHPDETVLPGDVEAAVTAGLRALEILDERRNGNAA